MTNDLQNQAIAKAFDYLRGTSMHTAAQQTYERINELIPKKDGYLNQLRIQKHQ